MHLLPNTLAPLAQIAEAKEGNRWAVTGVRLTLLPDGKWQAVATDTKMLLMASGEAPMPADDFPTWDALENAPNTATQGLVPASHWATCFAAAKKLHGKRKWPKPPAAVAVKLAPNAATLAYTDLDSHRAEGTKLVEGKFPPVDTIWPRRPKLTVPLDPDLLGKLLKAMGGMMPDDEGREVYFDIIDPLKPVILRAKGLDGVELKGLIMPLGEKGGGGPEEPASVPDEMETAENVAAWKDFAHRIIAEKDAIAVKRDDALEAADRLAEQLTRATIRAERAEGIVEATRDAQAGWEDRLKRACQERDEADRENERLRQRLAELTANLAEADSQREAWQAAAMTSPDDTVARLREDLDAEKAANDSLRVAQVAYARDLKEMTAERDTLAEKVAATATTIRCLDLSGRQLVEDRERLQLALHQRTTGQQPTLPQPPTRLSRRERLGG